jgi:hypothetical protein
MPDDPDELELADPEEPDDPDEPDEPELDPLAPPELDEPLSLEPPSRGLLGSVSVLALSKSTLERHPPKTRSEKTNARLCIRVAEPKHKFGKMHLG